MAITVDKGVFKKRFNICKQCPHLFKPTNSCKKCGCFMNIKARIAKVSCPINKWEAEE